MRLGGKLYGISPILRDPTEELIVLEVTGDTTLRVERASGYASPAEELRFELADGRARGLRGLSGMSWYPFDEYASAVSAVDTVRVGAPVTPRGGA